MMQDQELVSAYFKSWALGNVENDFDWAREEMAVLVRAEPELAWELTLQLIAAAPSREALAYTAAGPLEDLIIYQPAFMINVLQTEAEKNKRLRFALACVWTSPEDELDEEVERIMEKYHLAEIESIADLPWEP